MSSTGIPYVAISNSVSALAGLSPLQPPQAIGSQFDALEKSLYLLREQATILEQQLCGVLLARAPQASSNATTQIPDSSPMAARLLHLTSVVEGLNGDLSSIRARLEL